MSDLALGLLSIAVYAAIFVPLERAYALKRTPPLRPDLGTDLLFLLGNFALWSPLVVIALVTAVGWTLALPLAWLREPFADLPWWLRASTAILLADLALYWFHRASHRWNWLWRIHRVHHSAIHLDWVAAYREHPLDNLLTRLIENLPPVLLGFSFEGIAGFVAFRGLWALYIHANVELSPGRLRWLLGSPRLHHWHHDPVGAGRSNFANLNPLMDLLFGTYHHPPLPPARCGDPGQPRRGYLGHLMAPLRP